MAKSKLAVILAGAVAKGAFEAGALDVLAHKLPSDVEIVRVIGASSGALNGTMFASGVAAGTLRESTRTLVNLWQREGGILNAFHLKLRDAVRGRGISDQKNLRHLLSEHVKPTRSVNPIDLRIIVSPLSGNPASTRPDAGTSYEAVLAFSQSDFERQDKLDHVFDAAVASSAFPILFAPADPGAGVGLSIDGGTVNNTPIKYAVEDGSVDTVVVILPTVASVRNHEFDEVSGLDLVGHVADMLINERLYRDLIRAEDVNASLASLDALVESGQLPSSTLTKVKKAIGWDAYRRIRLVIIRPDEALPGNSFSAFLRPAQRAAYIELGRKKATDVLVRLGW